MWNALKDYSLFSKLTLENDMKGKMLCKCCVSDFLNNRHNQQANINMNGFGLNIESRSSTFATILMVECHSRKHSFVIKPPCRQEKELLEPPKKEDDHKVLTV